MRTTCQSARRGKASRTLGLRALLELVPGTGLKNLPQRAAEFSISGGFPGVSGGHAECMSISEAVGQVA